MAYRTIAQLKTAEQFGSYLQQIGADLPFDPQLEHGPDAPLAQPYLMADGFKIGNRFCVQPMEGWDGTPDGKPTDLTIRRWENFGRSGAKLIWGGEAVAVRHDGRANPNQLMINPANLPELQALRQSLLDAHAALYGSTDDLLIGLQLTHSGRFARPNHKSHLEPIILYHHPFLDQRFNIPADYPVMTDEQIQALIADFIDAAEMAASVGYQFVDLKHCHGYLGHEFLSAVSRPGPYGGSFENRTRFLRELVAGIRQRVPGLRMGVRLSAFDFAAFKTDPESGIGQPVAKEDYPFRFGGSPENPLSIDLDETAQFLSLLCELGIELVNLTAGSPYYVPHIQRPAFFPPSDGYQPPEDPLIGVARQVQMAADLKSRFPNLLLVGSAYSYLQEWLPNVGQYNVRNGRIDMVGLGRMVLSYPEFPADVLTGKPINRKRLCRTFSDCTTAPRKGLVSGCYPLDPYYKERPEAGTLIELKKA
jgi:2,4-dienoyl-CoA reductase-like NADH-dependent reductase (Old Yellow Enzyme family)